MSGLLDTNILVYAADRASPYQQSAQRFITQHITNGVPLYLCLPSVYEFFRVTTHPRVFAKPLSWQQAWDFIATLIAAPTVDVLHSTPEHLLVLQSILQSLPTARGNFLHDCHIAAVMKEHGVKTIYTRDTDFRLFPFLNVVDPC